jgi:hypothetical protein
MIDDASTMAEARDWLRLRAPKGERCPCCQQFVKVYRRKLNAAMARAVIILHQHGRGWVQFDHLVRGASSKLGHDFIGLHYWGLTEKHAERAGYWRITDKGESFARNESEVNSHAVLYDGRCIRLDGDQLSIRTALGRRFDYDELMRERPMGVAI